MSKDGLDGMDDSYGSGFLSAAKHHPVILYKSSGPQKWTGIGQEYKVYRWAYNRATRTISDSSKRVRPSVTPVCSFSHPHLVVDVRRLWVYIHLREERLLYNASVGLRK